MAGAAAMTLSSTRRKVGVDWRNARSSAVISRPPIGSLGPWTRVANILTYISSVTPQMLAISASVKPAVMERL
jgi:hypothetical protein